jgi:hypothetical protein
VCVSSAEAGLVDGDCIPFFWLLLVFSLVGVDSSCKVQTPLNGVCWRKTSVI